MHVNIDNMGVETGTGMEAGQGDGAAYKGRHGAS